MTNLLRELAEICMDFCGLLSNFASNYVFVYVNDKKVYNQVLSSRIHHDQS